MAEHDPNAPQSQLPLPLPAKPPRYDREAFLIAPSNEAAWRACEAWLASEEPMLVVSGPPGAGKTHLAAIFAGPAGAFADWTSAAPGAVAAPIIVFDNLPPDDPRRFLTRITDMTDAGKRLILVGAGHPRDWSLGLKDLRTRLEAAPRAELGHPDEALLRAVLTKAFSDRQVVVSPDVIEYAAPRLPRRFEAAHRFAAAADRLSAARKRKISVALAREALESAELTSAP